MNGPPNRGDPSAQGLLPSISQCAFKQHQVDLIKHVNTVDEGFHLEGPGVTADAKISEPNFR